MPRVATGGPGRATFARLRFRQAGVVEGFEFSTTSAVLPVSRCESNGAARHRSHDRPECRLWGCEPAYRPALMESPDPAHEDPFVVPFHHLGLILSPPRLYRRSEILSRPCPVPHKAGVYGWYMRGLPVDVSGCRRKDDLHLVYVGIAPQAPAMNGRTTSRRTLRDRIRTHCKGNASGSTLRLTLGVLLGDQLGIRLQRVGSGARMTFTRDGERLLSAWIEDNACVTWIACEQPWLVEANALQLWDLPLNLQGNERNRHHARLSSARATARTLARSNPVAAD